MRIATSQIFDAGSSNILKSQSSLYKLQNQLSTGRRVLTPQDDPVAASQALLTSQSMEVNAQHIVNQGQAKSQLGLVESRLTGVSNLLNNVRERVVQAGNTTLSQGDRASIASELESRLSELLGIANSDNGVGEYLFSGYSGHVKPFALDPSQTPAAPATQPPVGYYGDSGERLLQVSDSRQMAISVSGQDLFMLGKQGNGTFVTGTGGNQTVNGAPPPAFNANGINQGTALVDVGSVTDPQSWAATGNPANFLVRFTVTTTAPGVTTTTYQLYDNSTPAAPVALLAAPAAYTPGQSIPLQKTTAPAASYGGSLVISGTPADGDSFTVEPSTNQSVFQTLQNLIGILRSPIGATTYTTTQYSNDIARELQNVDQAMDNVSRVQASIGTRLQEIDALGEAATDKDVQFKATLSDLQDIDYAKTISDFMQQQMNLEAAQSSFAKVAGLSLFNYI